MTAPTETATLTLTGDRASDLAALRARGPITRIWLPRGVQAWLVTDPDLILRVLTDPWIVKNPRHWPPVSEGRIGTDWPLLPYVSWQSVATADDDEHLRLREILRPGFTAAAVTTLGAGFSSLTEAILDTLSARGSDETVDLRGEFADVVTARFIGVLMGVPTELSEAVTACIAATHDLALTAEQARVTYTRINSALAELVAYKHTHHGEDLGTLLARAHRAKKLSRSQVHGTTALLLTAVHDTGAPLLDHAIVELLTHPLVRDRATRGTLRWKDLVEETLRMWAPLRDTTARYPMRTVEIGEVRVEPGELIYLSHGAAGRDRRLYRDPDTFDPTRGNLRFSVFGHGLHACLGAPVARMQAVTALSMLSTRFPGRALACEPSALQPRPSVVMAGHHRIPVRLGPAAPSKPAVEP
ncbi:cytochrome P450 [Nocardia takedensis]|uniref:cytochrome P450 n=1 Tax=Nocardia takedensis TaxID=259390 RepID=UPI003F757A4F